jgi:hypothetical protein
LPAKRFWVPAFAGTSGENAASGSPKYALASAIAAAGLLLAACVGDRGPAPAATGAIATPAPSDMAGRWALSGAAGGTCAMNLGGGGSEGTIRPEGGCPGNFFTSRKWTFESGALVIRDHNNQPLARLTQVVPGRFEGQSTAGPAVSLVR